MLLKFLDQFSGTSKGGLLVPIIKPVQDLQVLFLFIRRFVIDRASVEAEKVALLDDAKLGMFELNHGFSL
jgi:hypothetical protein